VLQVKAVVDGRAPGPEENPRESLTQERLGSGQGDQMGSEKRNQKGKEDVLERIPTGSKRNRGVGGDEVYGR